MLVIVKSGPDTAEGNRGVSLARDMAADIVFLQNGVYFALGGKLDGFCGTAYVLDEDSRLRGISDEALNAGILRLDYDRLVDIMAGADKVVGMI
ncbi:MAG TPA: DsrH/TusB family sulfur metabolism protein [Dissulfurispiraceae bacterium]|nr:DsrH/TusB family sulfur metabolism protein [Dissulfurispiraceae bacterium]